MPWIQLKLNTTGANAEDLSDALMEAGAVSITFQDTHDTPVFELSLIHISEPTRH